MSTLIVIVGSFYFISLCATVYSYYSAEPMPNDYEKF